MKRYMLCFIGGGVHQSITPFEDAPTTIASVIWDLEEKNIIMM